MSKQKDLKIKILEVLEKYPETRNSDIRLTQAIWYFYYQPIIKVIDNKQYIALKDLSELPSQDDIKRIRAKIQNDEHKFLPTNWAIAKLRKWNEEDWRRFLGYNPELRTI